MIAVTDFHRLWEIPCADQSPDVCVGKLDAFIGKAVQIQ